MKTQKLSLRKIVSYLNNPEEDGGFWLPNIQRPFVWSEEQICRLFDSILRQYPISTLLIWKTAADVHRRRFIDYFKEDHRDHLSNFKILGDTKKKCLVLDGQQRLQSLFIGLRGSYDGKELFLDILSGDLSAPDDVRFKFKFLVPKVASFPHVRFKDIVFCDDSSRLIAEGIGGKALRELTGAEKDKIKDHVDLILKMFMDDAGIGYQELDSIDHKDLYKVDDVVEIFIRANSGGTRLGKSDLLFSLLTSSWDDAGDNMEELLDELNSKGYAFTQDFVLKTCLTLLDQGARYEVEKFRKDDVRKKIEENWEAIVAAVKDVTDFVFGKTFLRCDKALPSYLVLIPLIYLRYHNAKSWAAAKNVEVYLLRALLAGSFSATPDQLIDDTVHKLKELNAFDLNEVYGVIRSANRSLEITEDRLWSIGYGSDNIHLLFNLWYREFNYTPLFSNNMPQVDHVFPQSALKAIKAPNPDTGKLNVRRYRESDRNQLANCMLLTSADNGAGGKGDKLPDEWFKGKDEEYLSAHLIPNDPELWKLDRFEDFIAARKELIKSKFAYLLTAPSQSSDFHSGIGPEVENLESEEETARHPDRSYWAQYTSAEMLEAVDICLAIINENANPKQQLNYMKSKIGLSNGIRPRNFVSFHPKKGIMYVAAELSDFQALMKKIDEAGIENGQSQRDGKWWITIGAGFMNQHQGLLTEFLHKATEEFQS